MFAWIWIITKGECTLRGAKGTERSVLGAPCSALDRAALRIAVAAALGEEGNGTAAATVCFTASEAGGWARCCCFIASLATLAMAR